jgi:endonuclease/exonuclease/phosphatase family metal-dependent hydrolase
VNTHLESTADHATQRIKQLKDSFKIVQDFPEDYTVLLAGDMNLRDKEVRTINRFLFTFFYVAFYAQ